MEIKAVDYEVVGIAVAELDAYGHITEGTAEQLRQHQLDPHDIEARWIEM